MPSPRDFRGSRRELVLAFSDGSKTAHEAGRALGRPTGSIFGVLKRMHAEGLLVADTDPPSRGTRYELAPGVREALRDAEAEASAVGTLERGQRLLLVDHPSDPIAAQRALSRESLAGSVAWAAEVGGGWLLALAPEVSSSYPLQRLEAALSQAGAACRQVHVTDLLDGDELRDRACWLLEDLEANS